MNKYHISTFLSLVLLIVFTCFLQPDQSFGASIKDRMAARIPAINSLKDQGVVGENNKGFLEFRSGKKEQQLVNAENKDRRTVYAAIAKQQKTSAEFVGQRRAQMIAQKGKRGHWYQKADGKWFKK